MNCIWNSLFGIALLLALPTFAQSQSQSAAQPRFGVRLNQVVAHADDLQTNNLQIELSMDRDGKTARYRVTLSGGQVSTEFLDKLAKSAGDALSINFQATLNPFEGGAEASIFLGRPHAWKSKIQDKAGDEKEITNIKSIGLTTKVALPFGKPVVIYDDENEKISVKLTPL